MSERWYDALEYVGVAAIVAGIALVSVPAAVIAAGVFLVVIVELRALRGTDR